MRFKVDENLPIEIAELLGAHGHDAQTVIMERMGGRPDSYIAQVCIEEKRVLVTLDLDFANIRAYPPEAYPGFVVLRVSRQDKPHILRVFAAALPSIERIPWGRQLWIVEETRIRVHGG